MATAIETRVPSTIRTIDLRQVLFFSYVGIALVLFTFLPPPFQKADEPSHFYRAVSLTNLDLVCKRDSEGVYGFQMKRRYTDLPDALHVWDVALQGRSAKFDRDWLHIDFSDPSYDRDVGVHDICNLAPFGYLPNAVGVLLGKPFDNPLVSFYLGRAFGAAFFVLLLVWALRVTPVPFRPPLYFYAALPLVLHQVSAINYDAVQLSLFPLIYAYLTRFATQEGVVKRSELLVLLGAVLWAVNTRTLAYVPLLLLFFAVMPARIAPGRRRYLSIAGGFFGVSALSLLLVGLVYLPRLEPPMRAAHIDAGEQVQFVLEHPGQFVAAAYETLRHDGDWLIMQSIGVFGWDDTPLDLVQYFAFIAIGAAVLFYVVARAKQILARPQLAVLLGVVVLTALSLFVSLYAVWTPVGAGEVEGVQGRYLVGLLPLAMFGLAQLAATVGKHRLVTMLMVVFVPILLYNLYRTIDLRYYG